MKFPMMVLIAMTGALPPLASAPMRDVPTHEEIVETARKAKQDTPPPVFKPVEGADPSVANRPKDLLARSEIFCHLGQATLIPKRAVLHLPKELSDRASLKKQAKFVPWMDFYTANRAWIRTVAVTRAQAEGRQPMDEETVKSFAKERRVVVATYQNGPISVNPLRAPLAEPSAVPGKVPAKPTTNVVATP